MKRPHVALFLFLISLQITLSQPFASTNAPPGASGGPEYVPGEVLIKFRSDVTDEQIATAFRGASLQLVEHVLTPLMRDKNYFGITRALSAMPVPRAVEMLRQLPGIEYAEPNWIYTHQETSDDDYFTSGNLWGMYGDASSPANQYGSQAAEAWAAGAIGSHDVCVGIIDEGIQYNHPDLAANMWVNPGEIAGNGIDDDDNGYIDDVYGWNAVNNNGTIYDSRWDDHGTHVAGTIGAVGGNDIGVVGVNWKVKLISGKFLGFRGGTTTDAIEAINYMTKLKKDKKINLVALNNSWGGGGYSQLLLDAIVAAANEGILFIAAAGNEGRDNDVTPSYPSGYDTKAGAGYDSVIAVAATTSSGGLASFSNYGATSVDLGAPGEGIYSTLPGGKYDSYSGTSMATPHVTGAVALYAASKRITMTDSAAAPDIKAAIVNSVVSTPSLAGKTVTGGRLNVSGFTPSDANAPIAPTALSATADWNSKAITLTWQDKSTDETGFEIVRNGTVLTQVPGTTTTATMTHKDSPLSPGTYSYSVRAYKTISDSTYYSSATTASAVLAPPSKAELLPRDDVTKGNWINEYGSLGYHILKYEDVPTFVSPGFAGYRYHEWTSPDPRTDARALQTPDGSSRFAACYWSETSFSIDLNFADSATPHRVSCYFLDYDKQDRQQTITISDLNTGASLITYPLKEPHELEGGVYLTWDITGPVRITVTHINPNGTDNAVISGIFFDPAANDTEPTVSIASPMDGAPVSGTLDVTANAIDDFGVTGVYFYVGNTPIGSDLVASDGWSTSWDTTKGVNGTYTLTAVALDSGGQTTSTSISVNVANPVDSPPAKPSNLSAVAVSKSQIDLAWTDNANNETGFKIERSKNGVDYSQIAVVGPDIKKYSATGLARNTTYYFRVRAYNTGGDGEYSNVASARTLR